MHIALFKNSKSLSCIETCERAHRFLNAKGITTTLLEEKTPITSSEVEAFDLALSFGGDGALLHALHRLGHRPPTMVGVNLGSLGFLAEIQEATLEQSLQDICQGDFTVSERMILTLYDHSKNSFFAVNEIAFHREASSNLIDLTLRVDTDLVNTFSADGLIVSTPSGSTAYSLSAGGPIVAPALDAVILTPICPHTISNRPIVLCPHSSIEVSLTRGAEKVGVAVDGMDAGSLYLGNTWTISLSPHRFKLLSFPSYNYFDTLRQKLGWTGTLRKNV